VKTRIVKWIAIISGVSGFSIFIWGGLLWLHSAGWRDFEKLSEIGSFWQGAAGSLFSLAAFLVVYLAFEEQIASEVKRDQEAREERRLRRKQDFENTFFRLLNLHSSIVEGLQDVRLQSESNLHGRNCFQRWHQELVANYGAAVKEARAAGQMRGRESKTGSLHAEVELDKSIAEHAYLNSYDMLQGNIPHYFRTFYHIIKFVDNSEALKDHREKIYYTSLARAQLTGYELAFLFYNCVSEIGQRKMRPLTEKYQLLEHLDTKLLLDKEHRGWLHEDAFGKDDPAGDEP
jgi:hypothetical protein